MVEVEEPNGWVHVPLSDEPGYGFGLMLTQLLRFPRSPPPSSLVRTVYAHLLQVAILANHQNGRDSHVRQVKVFAPARCGPVPPPFRLGFSSASQQSNWRRRGGGARLWDDGLLHVLSHPLMRRSGTR